VGQTLQGLSLWQHPETILVKQIDVSDQLHASAALFPVKETM
jgi:hypothetical protein